MCILCVISLHFLFSKDYEQTEGPPDGKRKQLQIDISDVNSLASKDGLPNA